MKIRFFIIVSLVAIIAGVVGYWSGFREGWSLSIRADAALRGSIAMAQLDSINRNDTDRLKFGFESEIDQGLIYWYQLTNSFVAPLINFLTGENIIPGYERSIRRLAVYRKKNKSPLIDSDEGKSLQEYAEKSDSAFVPEVKKANEYVHRALNEMVEKYSK